MVTPQEARITAVSMSSHTGLHFTTAHIETISSHSVQMSVAEAIQLIEMGWHLYVQDPCGKRAYVEVVHRADGPPYVRARRDNSFLDNLLFLPGGPFYFTPLRGLLASPATLPSFSVGLAVPNLDLAYRPLRGLLTPQS